MYIRVAAIPEKTCGSSVFSRDSKNISRFYQKLPQRKNLDKIIKSQTKIWPIYLQYNHSIYLLAELSAAKQPTLHIPKGKIVRRPF